MESTINYYHELTYQLYKLKMNNPGNESEISKLELELLKYIVKNNPGNIEKINASLYAIEKYNNELKNNEKIDLNKRRGITIYEDLTYKLYKLNSDKLNNYEKIKKIETKINECLDKYQLTNIEKIDAKLRAFIKYNEFLNRKEENKKIGLKDYYELSKKLHYLKQQATINKKILNELATKIRNCSNKYNLNNLDKITIQFKILEENNS